MPPKKKLSKKEKARLEAEQAELLRIEMEKEKQKKLEEALQRKQIELEQCQQRQQRETEENKKRRSQLKNTMAFFAEVRRTIGAIHQQRQNDNDWLKYMRCNGLPNANIPSDLRKYLHQWLDADELREKMSRNWLLQANERTLLTHDSSVVDLTQATLRKKQGNLGDLYAARLREVLSVLRELDEAIRVPAGKPLHTISDLVHLKTEIRLRLKENLDAFTHKIMSHIDRDMEVDRPGVSKHIYNSDVFKTHSWTFAKDAQVSSNAKKIGDQNQHIDIEFPDIDMLIALPPSVSLYSSSMRGLWLNFDHLSDYCQTLYIKKARPANIDVLAYTKREWRKRKEILQNMLIECQQEVPDIEEDSAGASPKPPKQRSFDVDKVYAEYENALIKERKKAIGPEAYDMLDTDVNLRKYRIIGGVYCIDWLETPSQDKRLNAKTFIRTITAPNCLSMKNFYQTYKPPPPVQPGVRRLPEEIEAEMRMIEAALDKLALATVQLPDSVIWFEPPIACRWEPPMDTLESDLTEGVKKPPSQATPPPEVSPLSTRNPSPLKGSPRYPPPATERTNDESKRPSATKSPTQTPPLPVRVVNDFDMLNVPRGVDIYGLLKDFIVPRLPSGFCVRLQGKAAERNESAVASATSDEAKPPRVLYLARHKNAQVSPTAELVVNIPPAPATSQATAANECRRINKDFVDFDEPREFFPVVNFDKILKLHGNAGNGNGCAAIRPEDDDNASKSSNGSGSDKNSNRADKTAQTDKTNGNAKGNGNGGAAATHASSPPHANGNGHGLVGQSATVEVDKNSIGSGATSGRCSQDDTSATGSTGGSLGSRGGDSGKPSRRPYMFSQLLEDLDYLHELQLPAQDELIQQISQNLSHCSSTSGPSENDQSNSPSGSSNGSAEASGQRGEPPPSLFNPALYAGISILRDLDGKHTNGKPASEEDIGAEAEEQSSSDECNDNADDHDPSDPARMPNERELLLGQEGDNKGGPTGKGGLQELLHKHQQSNGNKSSAPGSAAKTAMIHGKWSIRDIHDTKFNEDKLSIQFRTGRLGIFGFALNRYSNMPYQTWDIRPDFKSGPDCILFNFTASIVSLEMTVTPAGYCVTSFQGGSTEGINNMIGRIMSLAELKSTLIESAVDIFPDEDAFCYTEGSCEKNYVMEMHLYACMSTLALSHNFSWSRWNLLAGSRTAVLLLRELIEGKKVPNHSTLLVTPLKTAIIECTEVSACFNAAGIAGMEYYADLYQLSQVHALPSSREKQRSMDPVLRDNVARLLMAIRPLSFC